MDPAMRRVNIFLKDRVHTQAKIVGVLRKSTLQSVLEQAVRDAIENDQHLLHDLLKQR